MKINPLSIARFTCNFENNRAMLFRWAIFRMVDTSNFNVDAVLPYILVECKRAYIQIFNDNQLKTDLETFLSNCEIVHEVK